MDFNDYIETYEDLLKAGGKDGARQRDCNPSARTDKR